MQKRVRKIANFFAFNILFFALYLNFIDKDRSQVNEQPVQQQSAPFGAATLGTQLEKRAVVTVASIK